MATPVSLRCPACGAPQNLPAEAKGFQKCSFCSSSFSIDALRSGAVSSQRASTGVSRRLRIVLSFGALALGGLLYVLVARPSQHRTLAPQATRWSASPAPDNNSRVTITEIVAPTPERPATAEFTFHTTYTSVINSLWLYGVVKNTSPFPISPPEVIAVFRDADGNEIYTEHGYPQIHSLAPNESVEMAILSTQPKPYATVTYEVDARRFTGGLEPAPGLRVEGKAERLERGRVRFDGRAFNDGKTSAKFVRVHVVGFDADGKVVGLGNTFVKSDQVKPGDSARYQIGPLAFAREPVRFELRVEGAAVVDR